MPCSTSLTSKGLRHQTNHIFGIYISCSTSLTSKGLRLEGWNIGTLKALAAPPWLQRDWDTCTSTFSLHPFLQHLPDFKGIETLTQDNVNSHFNLQHLPDFKGIETGRKLAFQLPAPCSTSLTSKGLRRNGLLSLVTRPILAAPPWLQRDWDA